MRRIVRAAYIGEKLGVRKSGERRRIQRMDKGD
jgi:hypothetical protein